METLQLTATERLNPFEWRWSLSRLDYSAKRPKQVLGEHHVQLNPKQWQYQAWRDIGTYLEHHTTSNRQWERQVAILQELGEWVGEYVFGGLLKEICHGTELSQKTILVTESNPNHRLPGLVNYPLELARMGDQSISSNNRISLVYGNLSGQRLAPSRVCGKVRILAVFSLPTSSSALNLRAERFRLQQITKSIAADGQDVEVRILQYGVTRERLRTIICDGPGWDVIHFSGHGLESGLVLEGDKGEADRVPTNQLVDILKPTKKTLAWVTLSSCLSGANARALERIDVHNRRSPAAGSCRPRITILAQAVSELLDCAVLAMRYPVYDEFATRFTRDVYETVLRDGKPLHVAVKRALPKPTDSYPPISELTPVLFGSRSMDLTVQADRKPPDIQNSAIRLPLPEENFVGRVNELSQCSRILVSKSQHKGILMRGMAGCGKSACAAELAWHHVELGRFRKFLWHSVRKDDVDPAGALRDFATLLDRQFPSLSLLDSVDDPDEFPRRLLTLSEIVGQSDLLLFLDQLDAVIAQTPTGAVWQDERWGYVINALLQHENNSRVIITSQFELPCDTSAYPAPSSCSHFFDELYEVVMNPLSLDESILLARQLPNLRALSEAPADSRDLELFREVLNAAKGHPRLLDLANAAIKQGTLSELLGPTSTHPFQAGEQAISTGSENRIAILHHWALTVINSLPERARFLFMFLCCMEDGDRLDHILEPTLEGVVRGFSDQFDDFKQEIQDEFKDCSPEEALEKALAERAKSFDTGGAIVFDINHGNRTITSLTDEEMEQVRDFFQVTTDSTHQVLSRLSAFAKRLEADFHSLLHAGLTRRLPSNDPRSKYRYEIHPTIADIGREICPGDFYERVAGRLAQYWYHGFRLGEATEQSTAGGHQLRQCARHAIPYLLVAKEFGILVSLLQTLLLRGIDSELCEGLAPVMDQALAGTEGTSQELAVRGMKAEMSFKCGRFKEAETALRELIDIAESRCDYVVANTALAHLIHLLRHNGRNDDALDVIGRKAEVTRKGELGQLISVIDRGMKLQILYHKGQHNDVYEQVKVLLEEIESIDPKEHSIAKHFQVRETTLNLAYSTAVALGKWEEALSYNRDMRHSLSKRGATKIEHYKCIFNNFAPLLSSDRVESAKHVLVSCKGVFEEAKEPGLLSASLSALARIERETGNRRHAQRMAEDSLRFVYQRGIPGDCAEAHKLLASLVAPKEALPHLLAAAWIEAHSTDGAITDSILLINDCIVTSELGFDSSPMLTVDGSGLQPITSAVEEVNGVTFNKLVCRLCDGDMTLARRTLATILLDCKSFVGKSPLRKCAIDMTVELTRSPLGEKGPKDDVAATELLSNEDHSKKKDKLSDPPDDPEEQKAWAVLVVGMFSELTRLDPDEAEECIKTLLRMATQDSYFSTMAITAVKQRGIEYRISGQFERAISDFDRMIELADTTDSIADGLINRGCCLGRLERSQEAIDDYTQVLNLVDVESSTRARALLNRGIRHYRIGEGLKAIADLNAAYDEPDCAPDDVGDALLLLTDIHMEHGQFEPAIDALTRVVRYSGALPQHYLTAIAKRASLQMAVGRRQEAISDLSVVLEQSGIDPQQKLEALLDRAVLLQQQGDADSANRDLNSALADRIEDHEQLFETIKTRVALARETGNPAGATLLCERAIQMCTDEEDAIRGRILLELAISNLHDGQPQAAVEACNRALALKDAPENVVIDASYYRGVSNTALRLIPEAVTDFSQVINHVATPSDRCAEALINRGIISAAENRLEDAVDDFTTAIDPSSTSFEKICNAHTLRVQCRLALGQQDRALVEIDNLLSHSALSAAQQMEVKASKIPVLVSQDHQRAIVHICTELLDSPYVTDIAKIKFRMTRAIAHRIDGNFSEALLDFDFLASLESPTCRRSQVLFNRAAVRGELGDYDGVVQDCEQILRDESDPYELALARTNLAIAFQHQYRWEDAISQFRLVLKEPSVDSFIHARAYAAIGEGLLHLEDSTESALEALEQARKIFDQILQCQEIPGISDQIAHIDELVSRCCPQTESSNTKISV